MPSNTWYAGTVTHISRDLRSATIRANLGGRIVILHDASTIKSLHLDPKANKWVEFRYNGATPREVREVRRRERRRGERKVRDEGRREGVRGKYRGLWGW
ncbi:hypothetical protein IMSHALPRED_001805 [Imshaugia aleurites]|uniref:Uncharacterized protein n=1 Tax=Imshaugia aleurites TaxID=172621 RepID=A0A8H3PGN5_9LECA|nr:hypothetical protein IMSHALPRED_001805 [Imshaugia aleurites]